MTEKVNKTEVLQVRCEADLIDAINRERRIEADPPSKAAMARILIQEALEARRKKAKR